MPVVPALAQPGKRQANSQPALEQTHDLVKAFTVGRVKQIPTCPL